MPQGVRDRVWLTAHIRMKTESRLRLTSCVLNGLMVWYSTALACLTVYQLIALKSPERDIISAALAIILLSGSTFIPSLKLDQQADRFRECYLKLQRLHDADSDDSVLTTSYYEILDTYPNHRPRDYTDFVVSAALNNQPLTTSGKAVLPTNAMYASYWLRRIVGITITIAAGFAPGLLYFIR